MPFPAPSSYHGPAYADLRGCIDLHMHSTCSDGAYEPEYLVDWAAELGLAAIALTDHDTTRGVDRAIARGRERGVEVIPGCEITVAFSGGTFHLLGFFVNHRDEAFNRRMAGLVESRNERNRKIVAALNQHGVAVSHEELAAEAGEAVIGRPHMAKIMIRKGYVKEFREAFDKYLGEGKPCYFDKEDFSPQDAIGLVLAAGGVPVLAHPRWLNKATAGELDTYIAELAGHGLRGMEVIYSDHPDVFQDALKAIAQKHGLLITGGSDFHGGGQVKPEVTLGHGPGGGFHVPGELLEPLRAAAGK
jgi:predicted metal-dependent phosphoesterase TrpH